MCKYLPRAKTVLVYWYWIPKPTTALPPSRGITPSCRPTFKQECHVPQFHFTNTLLLFLHWTTSLSSWWPARSTPPSSNSAASSLGGRYTCKWGSEWLKRKEIPCWRAEWHLQLLNPYSHPLQPQCLAEWRKSDITLIFVGGKSTWRSGLIADTGLSSFSSPRARASAFSASSWSLIA